MRDRRVQIGVLLGLVAAFVLIGAAGPREHGPILSDCDGAIEELVIHYVPEAAGIVESVYREFLGQLPADVTVHVVCPDMAAFDDLRTRVGDVRCRLSAVPTGHAMTCWSRDRWLAFAPARSGGPSLLLCPSEEEASAIWPERRGDALVGMDLSEALGRGVVSHRSRLAFDGGDFVADGDTVFVTPAVSRRNPHLALPSARALQDALSRRFRRRVVLLAEAPPHHAGMFMMAAGDGVILVGDPSLARSFPSPLADADFSEETQRLFDAVADQCRAAGRRVVRIPVVPGRDGRTYLSYVNVIIDEQPGERTVYMPVYGGAEALNAAAADVWRGLGYRVRPVDCTATYRHFGSLRCLVNVLRRAPAFR